MMASKRLSKLFLSMLIGFPFMGNAQTWEVYDPNFKMTSRITYDHIILLSESVRLSNSGQQLRLLNKDFKPFMTLKGHTVDQYLEPWIVVKGEEGVGVYHEYGEEILPPIYDHIEVTYTRILAKKAEEYWVYDRPLKKIIPLGTFKEAKLAKNGQVIAKIENGYVLPLSPQPNNVKESIEEVNEFILKAKEKGGFGLLNSEGKYVLEPIIDQLTHLEGNFFHAFDGKEYMLIKAREERVDITYTSYHKITLEPNGMMLEYIHGKLRRIMKNDGILLDIVGMEKVEKTGQNFYNINFRDKTVGLFGLHGWEVKPTPQIEKIFPGSSGLFPALKNGKYGFVNALGNIMIPTKYDQVKNFSNDLAAVKINGKWGFINSSDEMIISPLFEEVGDFTNGIALVRNNNKSNLINSNGELLLAEGYQKISYTPEGYFITEDGALQGMIDKQGKEIVSPSFEHIRKEKKDVILVKKDNHFGIIDESGNFLLPLFYKNILFDNDKVLAEDLFKPQQKRNSVGDEKSETKSKKIKKGA